MPNNRRIDQAIFSGQWEIEEQFAQEQMAWYAHQLDLQAQGIPYEELELSKRRQESLANIFTAENGYQVIKSATTNLSSQEIPKGSFAHLKLSGVMRAEDGLSSRGIQHMADNIAQAEANPRIRGGIIEANTGGGQAIAGTILSNALKEALKPWMVYYHQLASAGVKGTLPARAIYASGEEAQIGSIGTMATINKMMIDYYRNHQDDIYADPSTEKNREFREYLKGNKGPLIERLNQSNEFFTNAVKKYRNINGTEKQRQRVFSGGMFFAPEAQEVGLTQGVATFNETINHLSTAAQADARAGGFHNNNQSDMNFKQFFQEKLMPIINTKLNLTISEQAQPEEIEQAIEEAQSIEEAQEAARTDMREEIAKQVREEMQKSQTGGDQSGQQQDPPEDPMEQINHRLQDLQQRIEELSNQNRELEGKLADKKNRKANQKDKQNTGAPDVEQFETVQGFQDTVKVEGNSKY